MCNDLANSNLGRTRGAHVGRPKGEKTSRASHRFHFRDANLASRPSTRIHLVGDGIHRPLSDWAELVRQCKPLGFRVVAIFDSTAANSAHPRLFTLTLLMLLLERVPVVPAQTVQRVPPFLTQTRRRHSNTPKFIQPPLSPRPCGRPHRCHCPPVSPHNKRFTPPRRHRKAKRPEGFLPFCADSCLGGAGKEGRRA